LSRVLLTRCANCGAQLGRSKASDHAIGRLSGTQHRIELGKKGDPTGGLDHYDQAEKTDVTNVVFQRNAALLPGYPAFARHSLARFRRRRDATDPRRRK